MSSPETITVTRRPNPWMVILRWVSVPAIALMIFGGVLKSISDGDASGNLTGYIWLGFLCGLVVAFIGLVEILRNRVRLVRLVKTIDGQELGRVLRSNTDPHDPFLAVIRDLYEQYRRNPGAVRSEVLIDLLRERLTATADFIASIGTVLVSGGLIGTCVGLTGMLGALTRAMENSGGGGPELMVTLFAADGPLAALDGAYISTLVGIACGGIVLRGLAGALRRSGNELVSHFEELVEVYIKPSLLDGGNENREPERDAA